MTAHHIRQRQKLAAAINAEAQAAATAGGESVPVPAVDPEKLPGAPTGPAYPDFRRAMWHERHFQMRYGYEITESETGWHVVLLEEEDGPGNGATEMGGGTFELSEGGYCEAYAMASRWLYDRVGEAHPLAGDVPCFANDGKQPGDADPLAGLGLRAGDLAAIQEQILGIVRTVQREHYRAMFMAAVIQGMIFDCQAGAMDEGMLLDRAESIADGALIRMGL
jgi:hypothetical protein